MSNDGPLGLDWKVGRVKSMETADVADVVGSNEIA